ncbi:MULTISPECIES: ribulokinase [unclassified Siphonobacter]|uniref:ribulokinase n=1 Tax=unclassified Siphonobacter TaxID=2635712 RepID=UPI000CC354EF|nr:MULTISPECIES: ribulokinase [unclassified Siphonobacter]MDQ1087907.1 L-ribulokinase [Siphonobacter sp. SORGH_AS_1065]MDR6194050.1 L-ribulokinase [Siphonobacter sp. SORGH_AS_0500]PKK36871.1 ribulokinase [Siphonobacter sp. SORGH_AS_0500]
MAAKYVIGVDYGTDSVRSLVLNAQTGEEIGTAVYEYPRWKQGLYCDAPHSQFRQHPLDYLEGLEYTIKEALKGASEEVRQNVVGISVDTTGSTPGPVDENGTPLALLPEFAENPNGMFILWKDHTANKEAQEINDLAHSWDPDFTKYVGGIYSSEWFWSKILRTLRVDEQVREKAFSWIEHCDWVSAVLTGNTNPLTLKRSRCAAGHKALWHEDFDGLPSEEFLTKLDPLLSGLRDRLFQDTYTSDEAMGQISKEWAEKLGISDQAIIGVGAFDAHMGAVGGTIEAYSLCKVIGTSTCDMLVAPTEEIGNLLVRGICGQVDGSVIPGMLGMEAGMSAYGDIYAWLQRLVLQPVRELLGEEAAETIRKQLIPHLSEKAIQLPLTENDPVAIDWFNGRRTPDANHTLKGAIMGLNLGSDTARVFKALVEATAYGSKNIVDRFVNEGVPIKQVIAIGGVARKSAFAMQTLANVLDMPIKIAKSDQACALGAAMFASVAAGVHANVGEAQAAMSSGFDAIYEPQPEKVEVYKKLYQKFLDLGHFVEFGKEEPALLGHA